MSDRHRARPYLALFVGGCLALLATFEAPAQTCRYESIPATAPASRFIVHPDATVTDKRTGLQWKRCSEGQHWDGEGCAGEPEHYTFEYGEAIQISGTFAGHDDWRLPTFKELASIVELACSQPAIDLSVFPNTPFLEASLTAFEEGEQFVRSVDFAGGVVQIYPGIIYPSYARLVRGAAAPSPDFTKLDAEGQPLEADAAAVWSCVRDEVTGLTWESKTNDRGVHDAYSTYSWYDPDPTTNGGSPGEADGGICGIESCDTHGLVTAVNAQGLCGFTDWRLPTREELLSLLDRARFGPTLDTRYFPMMAQPDREGRWVPFSQWTSSATLDPDVAWILWFAEGMSYVNRKNDSEYLGARLVRGTQPPAWPRLATQTSATTYKADSILRISASLEDTTGATPLSLVWRPRLPEGWQLSSVEGDGAPELSPDGASIQFRGPLESPLELSYGVMVPAQSRGPQWLRAEVEYLASNMDAPVILPVLPDPLYLLSTHAVSANATPADGGSAVCDPDPVSWGEDSTCTATAYPGYVFAGWSGDCIGTRLTCTLAEVTTASQVTARFVPKPAPSQLVTTPDAMVEVTTGGGGTVAVVLRNADDQLVVFVDENDHSGWTAWVIGETLPGPDPSGSAVTFIDPKDGLLHVAYPSDEGLMLYRRSADGNWGLSNLTRSIGGAAEPIEGSLAWLVSPPAGGGYEIPETVADLVSLLGVSPRGELVRYAQRRNGATIDWTFTNLSQRDLLPRGQAVPDWAGELIGYATPWNGHNVAGLNPAGEVVVAWSDPNDLWSVNKLADYAPTATLIGGLSAYVNWGINLTGILEDGRLAVTWWSAQYEREQLAAGREDIWAFSVLSDPPTLGPRPRLSSAVGLTTPSWPSNNIYGLDAETGHLVAYWWGPGLPWNSIDLNRRLSGSGVPVGRLSATAAQDGTISVLGVSAEGELLRFFWNPQTSWGFENLSRMDEVPDPDLIFGRYLPTGAQSEIILDLVTGLEWQRCSLGQTWNPATRRCDGDYTGYSWDEAVGLTAAGGFRTPAIDELRTLVYCSSGDPVLIDMVDDYRNCERDYLEPTIVPEAFPDTPAAPCWSSSVYPHEGQRDYGWLAYFGSGQVSPFDGQLEGCARLVRDAR